MICSAAAIRTMTGGTQTYYRRPAPPGTVLAWDSDKG